MNKPPHPLNGDDNLDPNIEALKRRGFMNHGSTLGILFRALGRHPGAKA